MPRVRRLILVLALGCSGDDEVDEEIAKATPCERLREHLIDIRLVGETHVDQAAHRTAMRQALGNEFLDGCSKLGPAQVTCATDAPDTPAAVACTTQTSN